MGHNNNQITIKDILIKHDNMYDVLLSMQLNLFPLSSLDLVDIDNEKQYGSYYAFSIPIPAELVKEAVLTAKKSDNYLSRLVLKYPYIQLIVEYWIINKIYSICQSNPKLIGASEFIKDYNSFNNYLCYHYLPYEEYAKNPEGKSNFGYTATFESMAKILLQSDKQIYKTISYKKESGYSDNSKEIIYNIAETSGEHTSLVSDSMNMEINTFGVVEADEFIINSKSDLTINIGDNASITSDGNSMTLKVGDVELMLDSQGLTLNQGKLSIKK